MHRVIICFPGADSGAAERVAKGPMSDAPKQRGLLAPQTRPASASTVAIFTFELYLSLSNLRDLGTPMNEVFLERYRVANSQTIALYKHILTPPPSGSYSHVPKPTQTHERKNRGGFHADSSCFSYHGPCGEKKRGPHLSFL